MNIDLKELTPVEKVGNYYLKREDKFKIEDICGGKVRSAYELIQQGLKEGYTEFCTAGSRMSPQCEIVSSLCQLLKIKCHLFMPTGKETSVLRNISKNDHSILHRIPYGYNVVILKRAKEYCEEHKECFYIPFGMECEENIEVTKHQVQNIPSEVKRIVMPIGSGMSFISVLNGLEYYGRTDIEVLGVSVGKDIQENINKYLKASNIFYNIVKSDLSYEQASPNVFLEGVELDPIYESKCLPFIRKGDLLWIVGIRKDTVILTLSPKKGNIVKTKDFIGKIIKYPSNKQIHIQNEEGKERIICKEDIIEIIK